MSVDLSGFRFNQIPENNIAAMYRQMATNEQNKLRDELVKRQSNLYENRTAGQGVSGDIPYQPLASEDGEYGNILPKAYPITQQFGNVNPALYGGITKGARHLGVDVGAPLNTPLTSPLTGRAKAGVDKHWGNYVLLEAGDGNVYRFSHLSKSDPIFQQAKDGYVPVNRGQSLGFTGSTGNSTGAHLDISVTRGGQYINPLTIPALERMLAGR